jgi:tetratricopeptide (TPR) repeat protein
LTILRKLVRPDHISIAYTLYSLGSCAAQAGDKPGAERYLREALSITTKLRDNRHEIGTSVLSLLARVLQVQGKPSEAEPLYREALQAVRDRVGDEHADTARGLTALASCLRDRQDFAEAEEYARQAFAVQRRLPNVSAADLAETLLTLGTTLSQKDDPSGAEPLLREAVEKFASVYGSATWRTADARRDLGECFRKLRRMEEAERELTEAHRVLSAAGPPNVLRTVKTVEQLAALYETWDAAEPGKGYAEKAAEWRVKLKTGE